MKQLKVDIQKLFEGYVPPKSVLLEFFIEDGKLVLRYDTGT